MVKKYKLMSWIAVLIAIVIAVLVNVFMSVFTKKVPIKIDLTSNKRYELTDESYEYLKTYETDTVFYVIASETDQDTNARAILDRYEAANSHIRIENVDPDRNPSFGREYVGDGETLSSNSVVVVAGDRSRVIENSEFYEVENGQITGLNVESKITSALKYVSSETEMNVYFTSGHGELELTGAKEALASENYVTSDISLMTEDIPENASALIIPRPTSDFSTADIAKIDAYLKSGGAVQVYLSGECPTMSNLYSYLSTNGITVNDDEIVEGGANILSSTSGSYMFITNYVKNDVTSDVISKKRITAYVPFSKSLEALFESSGEYTVSEYLASSDSSYTSENFESPTKDTAVHTGSSSIALMSENSGTGGKLYVSGTTMLLSKTVTEVNDVGLANFEYFTSLTNSMTGAGEAFVVPVKSVGANLLIMSTVAKGILFIIFVIIFPAALLTAGLAVFFRRRNM